MIDPTMVSINDLTVLALLVTIVLGIDSMSASSSSDDNESGTVRDCAKMVRTVGSIQRQSQCLTYRNLISLFCL
jgi:hypothetical protein